MTGFGIGVKWESGMGTELGIGTIPGVWDLSFFCGVRVDLDLGCICFDARIEDR
jgi:hypothetical protein